MTFPNSKRRTRKKNISTEISIFSFFTHNYHIFFYFSEEKKKIEITMKRRKRIRTKGRRKRIMKKRNKSFPMKASLLSVEHSISLKEG
jgi:hypothetical protein